MPPGGPPEIAVPDHAVFIDNQPRLCYNITRVTAGAVARQGISQAIGRMTVKKVVQSQGVSSVAECRTPNPKMWGQYLHPLPLGTWNPAGSPRLATNRADALFLYVQTMLGQFGR